MPPLPWPVQLVLVAFKRQVGAGVRIRTLASSLLGRSSLHVTLRFSSALGEATTAEAAVRRRVIEVTKLTMLGGEISC
jgi:hypothetical protein